MSYHTSKDYEKLLRYLEDGEHIIVLQGTMLYWAVKDKYKGYSVGDDWFDCDVGWTIFYTWDDQDFIKYCEEGKLEFLDPMDYCGE